MAPSDLTPNDQLPANEGKTTNSGSNQIDGSKTPGLSLVMPCYNEAEVLRNTVQRLVGVLHDAAVEFELILVDNGSTDSTGSIIDALVEERLPVRKETVEVNQGYGNGLLQGFRRCRGNFVGTIPADGQVDAPDVVRLFQLAVESSAPLLVKARRRFRMDGYERKVVSVIFNFFTIFLFGRLGSIDINGNPKILHRETLERMQLVSKDWFIDTEMLLKARALGVRVLEFNVMAQMRAGGETNVRPSTCWEFVINLLKERLHGRRSKLNSKSR